MHRDGRRSQSGARARAHLMCARHEVVLANGLWTESFQPDEMGVGGIDAAQRDELFSFFPELRGAEGRGASSGDSRRSFGADPLT